MQTNKEILIMLCEFMCNGWPTDDTTSEEETPNDEGHDEEGLEEVRFDRKDQKHWNKIHAFLKDLPDSYLLNLLAKYQKELAQFIDKKDLTALGLFDTPYIMAVYDITADLSVIIKLDAQINKQGFMAYVEVLKKHGFKFEPIKKSWFIPFKERQVLDLALFVTDLDELGIESAPIPDAEIETIDQFIMAIKNGLVSNTIALKCFDDGKYSFYSTMSYEFNDLFSNKSGLLTGITEYNPEDHGRETYDLELVEEALAKIKTHIPKSTVYFDNLLQKRRDERKLYLEELKKPIPGVMTKMANGLALFPYQNEGVRFLEKTGGNALIGDEMGLGKTIQTLAWVAMKEKTAIAIVPKVVRCNWTREAKNFFPHYFSEESVLEITPPLLHEGLNVQGKNLLVVNYESFEKCLPFIPQNQFNTLIIDESHRIKSEKAKITKTIKSVAHNFDHKILLSGTAVKNKKEELFNQLELVCPKMFLKKELKYGTIGGIWHKMRSIYIARQKINVLSELPEKITSIAEIDGLDLPTDYPQSIDELSAFKNKMAIAKTSLTVEFISEILDSSDSCILVFTDSLDAAKIMARDLAPYALLHHGKMSDVDREKVKDLFQNPNCEQRVLVSTRQSLAVGATLTRADKVVFNDLPWSAADVRQAEDRVHRIGQRHTVNVYWITGKGNLWDDRISELVKLKYALTKAINEGKQLTPAEREWMERPLSLEEILGDFWKRHRKKHSTSSSVQKNVA